MTLKKGRACFSRKGYWKNKCFKLVSEIVRLRDGGCIETKTTKNLQGAHIISRSYKATAFDLDNVVTLSSGRHQYYTYHSLEWKDFINKHFGKGYYEKLEARALIYHVWSLDELKELHEKLLTIRNSWCGPEWRTLLPTNPGRAGGIEPKHAKS